MGLSARKCPGWQQGSKGDCSKWPSPPSFCITMGNMALQLRGELGMLSYGMQQKRSLPQELKPFGAGDGVERR